VGEAPVQDGPDASTERKSGTLLAFIDHCARPDLVDDTDYGNEVLAFCDEPSGTLYFIAGSAEVQERIHETLTVIE
jgi:hypothetical protein